MKDKEALPVTKALLTPRDERGHFLKGHSGNPSGRVARPIKLADGREVSRTELFQMHLGDAVQCLADTISSTAVKPRDKIAAAKILIEHAVGTPKQHVDLTTNDKSDNTQIIAVTIDQTELDVLKRLLAAEVIDVEGEVVEGEFTEADDE